MTASVLFIGLDAAEPALVERFVADGTMPNVTRLVESATSVPLRPARDLPGAMWPELATGKWGARSGIYFPPAQIVNGSSAQERVTPAYLDRDSWFWVAASRAGKRVASIDMTHASITDCDAFEIVEWGSHDRMISATESSPRAALEKLEATHGLYPVHSCDAVHHCTDAGYRRLTRSLIEGARTKGEMTSEVLASEPWDLFSVVFTETHCACHQLWHFHDRTDHRHPAECAPDLGSALSDVYAAVDRGVGRVIESAGPDARIVLSAIKGATGDVGGPQLVSDVLAALELTRPRSWKGRLWDEVPSSVKGQAIRIPLEWRNRSGVGADPGIRMAEGKARALRNDQVGALRIHVAGRDPGGVIQPGAEATAVLDLIESAFRELRHVGSGRPVVTDVVRLHERYGSAAHPDLPDLTIEFNQEVGLIEQVVSDRLGRLRRPYRRIRSGHHTGHGQAWFVAPEAVGGVTEERAVCDVTASLLTLAEVPVPTDYDGEAAGVLDV